MTNRKTKKIPKTLPKQQAVLADGVCSIDSEDDEADQPTTVHMPEEEPADDAKPEQDDSADDAEKTIPISSGDED
ncbi:MAG: hypothetical protein ACLT29_01375 [Ruminococcus callidus]